MLGPPLEYEQRFIAYLEGLAAQQDRGALAALRRGLGKPPGEAAEMYPHVVPWLPARLSARDEAAFFLVAALFAWHQESWQRDGDGAPRATNLGASFARLAEKAGPNGRPGIEQRFVALLNCHGDDLAEHLRHAVGLLRAGAVPVDWAQLLRDIRAWDRADRAVQRAWARAFWGVGEVAVSSTADQADQADLPDHPE